MSEGQDDWSTPEKIEADHRRFLKQTIFCNSVEDGKMFEKRMHRCIEENAKLEEQKNKIEEKQALLLKHKDLYEVTSVFLRDEGIKP